MEAGTGSEGARFGDRWAALHREICRNWRRRVRPPLEVEDIASEVVCRAFAQFGELGLPWPQLRAWGLRAAHRLVVDQVRRLRLARCNQEVDVDSIPALRTGGAEVEGVHRCFRRLTGQQWLELAPLLPEPNGAEAKGKGGPPWRSNRECLDGIVWMLLSEARWKDLRPPFPSGVTCWRRWSDWQQRGLWSSAWDVLLRVVDEEQQAGLRRAYASREWRKQRCL